MSEPLASRVRRWRGAKATGQWRQGGDDGTKVARDVVLIQTTIGDYRQAVLELLIERLGSRFVAYAGRRYFQSSLTTGVKIGPALRPLRNRFLGGRRLLWQGGAIRAGWSPSVAILEYNPRILSVWVLLALRACRSRRTLLWGHAWSRSGRSARSEPLRRLMRTLAYGVIVYSRDQADQLAEVMPRARVFIAPNALYRGADMQPLAVPIGDIDAFVFVGRLVAEKRADRLLRAFRGARGALPPGTRLVIIGDGPMRQQLEWEAKDLSASVAFLGHVGDHAVLRQIYSSAIASVSPGAVGLSLIQSLGFGVPMVIVREARHGPELGAAIEGWNAAFYRDDVPNDLEDAMIRMAAQRSEWTARRSQIADQVRAAYSVESMAEGLLKAIGLAS